MGSLFIYNVASIEDRQVMRKLEICWAKDGKMAILFINDYPYGVFDFEHLVGYNCSKYPEPGLMTMRFHKEV